MYFGLEKLMTGHNILYFTELKSQRTFKRERGGVYVFLGLFLFFLASLSVTLELMQPSLVPLYWTLLRLAHNIKLIKDQDWL